jgi:hypothetical protein
MLFKENGPGIKALHCMQGRRAMCRLRRTLLWPHRTRTPSWASVRVGWPPSSRRQYVYVWPMRRLVYVWPMRRLCSLAGSRTAQVAFGTASVLVFIASPEHDWWLRDDISMPQNRLKIIECEIR